MSLVRTPSRSSSRPLVGVRAGRGGRGLGSGGLASGESGVAGAGERGVPSVPSVASLACLAGPASLAERASCSSLAELKLAPLASAGAARMGGGCRRDADRGLAGDWAGETARHWGHEFGLVLRTVDRAPNTRENGVDSAIVDRGSSPSLAGTPCGVGSARRRS